MSIAVIQGCSSGLGFALTQHVLRNTSLKVYALTHQKSSAIYDIEERILNGTGKGKGKGKEKERLNVIGDVDVREEEGLDKAARIVKDREGKRVRLVACLAGVLHPEKSLSAIDPSTALTSFQINTMGHLLTYKHFVPLIPNKRELANIQKDWNESNLDSDPAHGLIHPETSLCFSLSARVGSIGDNDKGGWYSYRASKAALNQIIRTLDHELVNKSSSATAIGYHPGTVLTSFTRPIIGNAAPDPANGRFEIDQAIEHMTKVMGNVRRTGREQEQWGGRCWDWRGERIEW